MCARICGVFVIVSPMCTPPGILIVLAHSTRERERPRANVLYATTTSTRRQMRACSKPESGAMCFAARRHRLRQPLPLATAYTHTHTHTRYVARCAYKQAVWIQPNTTLFLPRNENNVYNFVGSRVRPHCAKIRICAGWRLGDCEQHMCVLGQRTSESICN